MNRLNLLFVLLVLSLTAQAGTPKLPKEKDLQAYLMVYHKDQDHGLHMAVSEDGYTWTARRQARRHLRQLQQRSEVPQY